MKIYIPEPAIAENEGFSEKADIFQRKQFGERLANLVRSCQDGIVIALDAQWGEGKSTFIKMWRGHIGQDVENPIKSLYFDAFANDYQKEPFLALAGELYDLVTNEGEEKKKEFKDKAKGVAKSLARGAVKIAVRTISGGIIDGSIIDSAEKDVSDMLADQVDSIIADKLENAKKDKLAIESFRGYLEKFAGDHGNGSPIVFIIDELDRCRPDFALDLLEQIKHLFFVKGIVFLLVLNRNALEEIIRIRYGSGISAGQYLQTFINLWLTLPRKSGYYNDMESQYIEYVLSQMLGDGERYHNEAAKDFLAHVSRQKRLSCREIERILSYFALIHNMSNSTVFNYSFQMVLAFVCYLKVANPDLIYQISKKEMRSDNILEVAGLSCSGKDVAYSYIKDLQRFIEYDVSDEEGRKKMQEEGRVNYQEVGYFSGSVLEMVSGWLSMISR